MKPLDLPGHFENRAGALLRFKACVSRASSGFERKYSSSLATRLNTAATRGRFNHQDRSSSFCLGFNQTSPTEASLFFVTSEEQHDRVARRKIQSRTRPDRLDRQSAIRLHVKNAWTVGSITFNSPGSFSQRPAWMNGIGMAQDDNWLSSSISVAERFDPQVLAIIFSWNSFNARDCGNRSCGSTQQRSDRPASRFVS
jgi:hypothetical protein